MTEALTLQESIKPIHGQTAHMLVLLGELAMQKGDLAEARPYLDFALNIWQQLEKENSPEIAHTYIILGEWHLAMKDHDAAQQNFADALSILQKTVLPVHPDVQRAQRNLKTI